MLTIVPNPHADILAYRSPLLANCPCGRHDSSDHHLETVRTPRRALPPNPAVHKSGRSSLFRFARDLIPRFCFPNHSPPAH